MTISRRSTSTGTRPRTPDQRWLFPGLQPGQPLHVFSASNMLKEIGLPARAARNTAWRQMVQQAPAAILADGLGAERSTAARHAKIAGADYASYPTSAGLQRRGTPSG